MDIYYINHKNQKIDFMNECFSVEDSSFFEHSWDYEESSENKDYGGAIVQFKKGIQDKSFDIHVTSAGLKTCEQAYKEFLDIIELDILEMKPGMLFINDYYLRCYITAGKPKYFVPGLGSMSSELTLISEYPFWIKENTRQFLPQLASESQDGLDFPSDFPFDFKETETGHESWNVGHYTKSHFMLRIFGACEDPVVYINDYPYQIFTELQDGEYLVIDSRNNSVEKFLVNGKSENIYNSRNFEYSVFEKIPNGNLTINWSGAFGFDLTLFQERSEPEW